MTQKDFPRGGKKPSIAPTSKSLLFDNNPTKPRKIKTKKSAKNDHEEDSLIASTAQLLSQSTLYEGMVILGRVHLVREYDLIISLPGRLKGRVKVTDISESYKNLLLNIVNTGGDSVSEFKTLSELFSPGDSVVTYVKALGEDDKWRISLSLEPSLINQNLNPSSIKNKSKVVCSIGSVEDHGFVVETGISNVRGFLSKNDTEEDHNSIFYPGKQIMCVVKNVKSADNSSIITLSTKAKFLQTISESVTSLDSLIPGTQLTLTVTKILSNGLQVAYNGDKIGYINQMHLPKIVSQYTPGMDIDGTLLYIVPTVKFAYFTLLKQIPEKSHLNKGEIVNGRVLYLESNGIVLKLGKDLKGFIPYKRTELSVNKTKEIFTPDSDHKCRVLVYDEMDRVYICSTEKHILDENYRSIENLTPGNTVEVIVKEINRESGFVKVVAGKIFGTVPPNHTCDSEGLSKNLRVGDKVQARVLSNIDKKLTLTLKPILVNSTLPILDNIHHAQVGSHHHGTIRQITNKGILVKFFGELAGWVPLAFLDPQLIKRNWNHFVGQVVTVAIKAVNVARNNLTLKIIKDKKKKLVLKVGEIVNGTVVNSSTEGIQVRIVKSDLETMGFIPAGHIAPCPELGSLIASKTIPGDELSALVFSTHPELLLSVSFSPQTNVSMTNLKPGSSILCSVKDFSDDICHMTLPLDNFFGNAQVKRNYVDNDNSIRKHQILLGKVLSIGKDRKEVILSTRLTDLWKNASESMWAIDTLGVYLMKMKDLSEKDYFKNRPISSVQLGQKVDGVVETITEHGLILKLKNDLKAIVRKDHHPANVRVGDQVKGVVLWVNFIYELAEVTLLPQLVSSIPNQSRFEKLPLQTKLRGTIVLITNWFILVLVKGQYRGGFVVMPARLHLNDLSPDLSSYSIGQKVRCFVVLNEIECNSLHICLPKSMLETNKKSLISDHLWKKLLLLNNVSKRGKNTSIDETKKEEEKDAEIPNQDRVSREIKRKKQMENGSKNQDEIPKKKRKKSTEEQTENKPIAKKLKGKEDLEVKEEEIDDSMGIDDENETELTIPECGFYWDKIPSAVLQKDDEDEDTSSDSDSDEEIKEQTKPKKKLTAAERREQERQKEKEIREREEFLASADQMPKSADQFDRLLLGSPDSSLIWLQYMAYHLQAAEVDKARAVAKRAHKTINFREEDERLNVWIAWLNLEIKFGNTESLNQVLQEAVRVNDSAKIYSHMLTAYAEADKKIELEKTVNMIVKKFKDQPEIWIKCGAALLKVGLKEKSRHIMQRALQSLPPRDHVNLIVRFAHLENNHGDKERSQTLFEQILNNYPKRVDVWSSYVDSVIKSKDIEIARRILERSVTTQVLPPKKMKVLFKKYLDFEEKYGNEKTVQNVRDMANDYLKEHTG